MSEKFKISLAGGLHFQLKSLEGKWQGTASTWFEPGILADESPWEGTMRSVLGGMFILHEYKGRLEGKPIEGIAMYGYSIGEGKFQSAWVDSFHNGTSIMFSDNKSSELPFSVLGSYGGEPRWGWKTVIDKINDNRIIISMYNISPEGQEDKAVEIIYERVV